MRTKWWSLVTLYNHEDKVVVATHELYKPLKVIVYKFYQCYRGGSVTAWLLSQQCSNKLLTKALHHRQ